MKLDPRLMFPRLTVASHEELFAIVGAGLRSAGYVEETYLDALIEREKSFPTGLAVAGGGVALPHTDASHVSADTLAVATLTVPLPFAPMGGETEEPVEVTTVIFLVFSDPSRHLQSLSRTVKAVQAPEFLQDLHAAETPSEIQDVLSTHVGP